MRNCELMTANSHFEYIQNAGKRKKKKLDSFSKEIKFYFVFQMEMALASWVQCSVY